jgi:hypothetical protein
MLWQRKIYVFLCATLQRTTADATVFVREFGVTDDRYYSRLRYLGYVTSSVERIISAKGQRHQLEMPASFRKKNLFVINII